jgi:hypothetical protein
MSRRVVEVVVRFGDTVLDIAHVGHDAEFRIGTGPDVDLAVPGHTSFPLVAGGRIRCPVGVASREHDGAIELQLGLATVALARRTLNAPAIERPHLELRTPAFVTGALAVHLSIWLCAAVLAPFERVAPEPARPRLRHVHVENVPEKPPVPPPKPPPEQTRAALVQPQPPVAHGQRPRRTPGAESANPLSGSPAEQAARFAASVGRTLDTIGELRPEDTYNEDDENAKGFGGSPRFPPGETIKTAPGYKLMLYDVRLCPRGSCSVSGPVPAEFIRYALHDHMDAIYDCYVAHADGPGTIVLEFTIAGDGSFRDAKGTGLGQTGDCAARVLPEISVKAIGDNDVLDGGPRITTVRYPLEFR